MQLPPSKPKALKIALLLLALIGVGVLGYFGYKNPELFRAAIVEQVTAPPTGKDVYIPSYQAVVGNEGEVEVRAGKDFGGIAGLGIIFSAPKDKIEFKGVNLIGTELEKLEVVTDQSSYKQPSDTNVRYAVSFPVKEVFKTQTDFIPANTVLFRLKILTKSSGTVTIGMDEKIGRYNGVPDFISSIYYAKPNETEAASYSPPDFTFTAGTITIQSTPSPSLGGLTALPSLSGGTTTSFIQPAGFMLDTEKDFYIPIDYKAAPGEEITLDIKAGKELKDVFGLHFVFSVPDDKIDLLSIPQAIVFQDPKDPMNIIKIPATINESNVKPGEYKVDFNFGQPAITMPTAIIKDSVVFTISAKIKNISTPNSIVIGLKAEQVNPPTDYVPYSSISDSLANTAQNPWRVPAFGEGKITITEPPSGEVTIEQNVPGKDVNLKRWSSINAMAPEESINVNSTPYTITSAKLGTYTLSINTPPDGYVVDKVTDGATLPKTLNEPYEQKLSNNGDTIKYVITYIKRPIVVSPTTGVIDVKTYEVVTTVNPCDSRICQDGACEVLNGAATCKCDPGFINDVSSGNCVKPGTIQINVKDTLGNPVTKDGKWWLSLKTPTLQTIIKTGTVTETISAAPGTYYLTTEYNWTGSPWSDVAITGETLPKNQSTKTLASGGTITFDIVYKSTDLCAGNTCSQNEICAIATGTCICDNAKNYFGTPPNCTLKPVAPLTAGGNDVYIPSDYQSVSPKTDYVIDVRAGKELTGLFRLSLTFVAPADKITFSSVKTEETVFKGITPIIINTTPGEYQIVFIAASPIAKVNKDEVLFKLLAEIKTGQKAGDTIAITRKNEAFYSYIADSINPNPPGRIPVFGDGKITIIDLCTGKTCPANSACNLATGLCACNTGYLGNPSTACFQCKNGGAPDATNQKCICPAGLGGLSCDICDAANGYTGTPPDKCVKSSLGNLSALILTLADSAIPQLSSTERAGAYTSVYALINSSNAAGKKITFAGKTLTMPTALGNTEKEKIEYLTAQLDAAFDTSLAGTVSSGIDSRAPGILKLKASADSTLEGIASSSGDILIVPAMENTLSLLPESSYTLRLLGKNSDGSLRAVSFSEVKSDPTTVARFSNSILRGGLTGTETAGPGTLSFNLAQTPATMGSIFSNALSYLVVGAPQIQYTRLIGSGPIERGGRITLETKVTDANSIADIDLVKVSIVRSDKNTYPEIKYDSSAVWFSTMVFKEEVKTTSQGTAPAALAPYYRVYTIPVEVPQDARMTDGKYKLLLEITDKSNNTSDAVLPIVIGAAATGDLSGDGNLSMIDVVLLFQIANKNIAPTPAQTKTADMNGDGNISLMDVYLLFQKVNAGK